MGIFDKAKKSIIGHRKTDEALYSIIAQEMEDGIRHNGLWLKALEQAGGNKERQIAEYIKLRVQSLRDDVDILYDLEKSKNKIDYNIDIKNIIEMIENNASIEAIENYFFEMERQKITAIINGCDAGEEYPIHASIKNGRIDLAEWLLKAGADPKVRNYWGNTPLELAEKYENQDAINLLTRYST